MSQLKLSGDASGTGIVTVAAPNTNSTYTVTLPASAGTFAQTDVAQTFTGTQTFSSNPVLNGGTANGVAYLNSSKVLTTSATLIWTGATQKLGFQNAAASGYGYIYNAGAGSNTDLAFEVGGSEQMRLTSTGLGIGTSSIAAVTGFSSSRVVEQIGGTGGYGQLRLGNDAGTMLDHDNSGSTTTTLRNLYGATSTSALMQIQSGYITFGTGTSYTERARITSGGSLLVKTTVDNNITCHFNGGANANIIRLTGASTTNSSYIGMDGDNFTISTGAAISERARITSGGELLVALTSQIGSGTICTTNSATKNGIVVKDSASGSYLYSGLNSSSSSVFLVLGSGNVQNANNSYGAISDVKLKENIVDATPKLDKLMQVRVRNYNLIGDTTKQIGVVAQELETVFPSMVDESEDRDADGNLLGTTTKGVKYSVFVPMLVKAIQELKSELDTVKAELAALKGV